MNQNFLFAALALVVGVIYFFNKFRNNKKYKNNYNLLRTNNICQKNDTLKYTKILLKTHIERYHKLVFWR